MNATPRQSISITYVSHGPGLSNNRGLYGLFTSAIGRGTRVRESVPPRWASTRAFSCQISMGGEPPLPRPCPVPPTISLAGPLPLPGHACCRPTCFCPYPDPSHSVWLVYSVSTWPTVRPSLPELPRNFEADPTVHQTKTRGSWLHLPRWVPDDSQRSPLVYR